MSGYPQLHSAGHIGGSEGPAALVTVVCGSHAATRSPAEQKHFTVVNLIVE